MMLGGTTSTLQAVQAKVGEMRESTSTTPTTTTTAASQSLAEAANIELSLDTSPTSPLPDLAPAAIDSELPQIPSGTESSSGWSRLWNWIPGVGR